jgi:putative nucleotidyltransferase with HDIG domain
VAALARVFSAEWGGRALDGVFLAGLVHDVGKLLTMQVGELDYTTLAPEARSRPDECHLHERVLLGYDHAVLGAQVLTHWKLPTELAQVVAWHHQPGRAYEAGGRLGLSVALVRLSDHLEYRFAESDECDPAFCEALAAEGAAGYAGLAAHHLVAMWPKLAAAREEALASFGVHRK